MRNPMGRRPVPWLAWAWLAAAACGGCMPTATIVWSPDGRRAAYGVYPLDGEPTRVQWSVLDADGRRTGDLDARATPFVPLFVGWLDPVAWSADSRALFFARRDQPAAAPTLCRWADGRTEPLAPLGPGDVLAVRPSPDGRWVAVLLGPPGTIEKARPDQAPRNGGDARLTAGRLVAVRVSDGAVRPVSDAAGAGGCFTGPDRLTFVRVDRDETGRPTGIARLVDAPLGGPTPGKPQPCRT